MLIDIKELHKNYIMGDFEVPALVGINLQIKKNEYVAIMGPSGSGKSTLMNILGCLDTPSTGNYLFNNVDVNTLNDDELSMMRNKEIGFIFQTFNLLPKMSALHNVELPLMYAGIGKTERIEMATKALDRVGLADRMEHKPSELSGGQRQRVAIARALVSNPGILLADEPTGALDSKTGIEIMNLFNELHKEGNTIIVITHEKEIAEYANRTIFIKDGLIFSDEENSKN
ncbi:MAG: ABC transporter ATP-binding protein [Prolixibacteraceae bacterium]|jgi:putative ABC transport system ATP-binding protein|nr:ABC transporter ATP-binding protein [Prolixibacteraceae bacterium]